MFVKMSGLAEVGIENAVVLIVMLVSLLLE